MSMDMLRFRVLRAFGVAPWSEEAKGLTEEMCLEYAALLDGEEEAHRSVSFDDTAFLAASQHEAAAVSDLGTADKKASAKAQIGAMSDYIEREMRCRDTGFITY